MLGIVKIENEFGKHKHLIWYKMFNGKMGVNNQDILNANNNLMPTLPKAQDWDSIGIVVANRLPHIVCDVLQYVFKWRKLAKMANMWSE
jgi:hypothetical protein